MASDDPPPISRIHERLRRADEHLGSFEAESDRFLSGPPRPYEFPFERRMEGSDAIDVYTFVISQVPPLLLSSIMGDALHNLRSALDHLAYALGEAHGEASFNSKARRASAFPIATRVEDFDTGKIRAVAPEVVTAIEQLQPYHRDNAKTHRLAALARLSNIDKHQTLHMTYMSPSTIGYWPERTELIDYRGGRPLESGEEIARLKWLIPVDGNMKGDATISVQIALGYDEAAHIRGASGFLEQMIRFVRQEVVIPLSAYL